MCASKQETKKQKNHTVECLEPWYSFIKQGKKTVEGRKAIPRWCKIKVGDTITFTDGKDDKFSVKVTGVNKYNSIEEYLISETLQRALPGIPTIEEGLKIYYQWSKEDDIKKYGFLGIQIELNIS